MIHFALDADQALGPVADQFALQSLGRRLVPSHLKPINSIDISDQKLLIDSLAFVPNNGLFSYY
jgi:hypothetical protein